MSMIQKSSKLKDLIINSDLREVVLESNQSLIKLYSKLEPVPHITEVQVKNISDVIFRSTSSHFGEEQYPTDESKLAFIFYSIIKGHFLENANKRTASDIFILFLYGSIYSRNTELKVFDEIFEETAQKAIEIAESKPEDKNQVISDLETWIKGLINKINSN